ncbi:MAG TPA: SHOCT domain-containing protein [Tepidisphaeraceae bacterium]|nr:SHOCT domain-containing protein [Tepidisphaeraceae bacterium]
MARNPPTEFLAEGIPTIDVVIPLAIILVIACGLMPVILWIRRRMRDTDAVTKAETFSISDLRKLRDSGQISDDEYVRAKAKMVSDTQQSLAKFSSPDLARDRTKKELDHQPKLDVPPQ